MMLRGSRIIPTKAFCKFAGANDALYPYTGRQRNCVDRLCANGRAAGNSDARNCLFAAPVSGERVTEPFGGLYTAG